MYYKHNLRIGLELPHVQQQLAFDFVQLVGCTDLVTDCQNSKISWIDVIPARGVSYAAGQVPHIVMKTSQRTKAIVLQWPSAC
jgi:hypothetical protein